MVLYGPINGVARCKSNRRGGDRILGMSAAEWALGRDNRMNVTMCTCLTASTGKACLPQIRINCSPGVLAGLRKQYCELKKQFTSVSRSSWHGAPVLVDFRNDSYIFLSFCRGRRFCLPRGSLPLVATLPFRPPCSCFSVAQSVDPELHTDIFEY